MAYTVFVYLYVFKINIKSHLAKNIVQKRKDSSGYSLIRKTNSVKSVIGEPLVEESFYILKLKLVLICQSYSFKILSAM